MKLTRFSIAGFRSIAAMESISLGSPTLLTGHNDAGKTAILDAVTFLLNGSQLAESDRTYADSAAGSDTDAAYELNPEVTELPRVPETWVEGVFTLSPDEEQLLGMPSPLRLRRIAVAGEPPAYQYFADLPVEPLLRGYEKDTVSMLEERMLALSLAKPKNAKKADLLAVLDAAASAADRAEAWEELAITVVKALPQPARFSPGGTTDAEEAIRAALQTAYRAFAEDATFKGNVRALEIEVETHLAAQADALRRHIKDVCADIGEVTISPAVSMSSGLKGTRVSVTGKAGESVHLDSAGAGRARRVSLAVWEFTTGLLEGSGDVVILYDEPDTHLDYAHQREFMDLVRKQCGYPNVQMLIATHSMNLIDGVDIADVVHVRHVDHRTVAERLTGDDGAVSEHLGAIAAALGLRNTVLLNERLFVGVEGPTETAALPVLFRLAKGKHLESSGIALWACNNNEGAVLFAEFLVDHNRQVVFLVDRDSKENSRHVFSDRRLAARKLSPDTHGMYIGDPRELEDIFSDELWTRAANKEYPRMDEREWVPEDFAQLRDEKKFSDAVLETLRTSSEVGPKGKPDMVSTLVLTLRTREEVPEQLCVIFDELERRAASDPAVPFAGAPS